MANSTGVDNTRWFTGRAACPHAAARVFCFPYAGAGASVFRSWVGSLGSRVEFCPVQLPGRETRDREQPFRRMDLLLDALGDALNPLLDVPFAFFGHSLGAVISFELARRFGPHPLMRRLFVSARRAPHLPDGMPAISHLADEQFVNAVQQRYAGIPEPILACPELLSLLLPRVRADFELLETHAFTPGDALACPISVFGGRQDFSVSEAMLNAWQQHTRGPVRVRVLEGDHLFLQDRRSDLIAAIATDLRLADAALRVVAV